MSGPAAIISTFSEKEVRQLFAAARRVTADPIIEVRRAPMLGKHGRILIVVPKKVGNAPTRNRFKRRIRAIFYQEQLYTRGYDCIVLARPGAAALSFAQLKHLLTRAIPVKSA